ncbi:hypothetical protein CEXT_238591 [Caerostris extrusa]|uniref:Uncharacterized protein n=1 Tax=Caerostris extrusa TaxID=172846 RepID=A0AAV4XNN5_CAEEX|nr:hypothetical protein CEXT_238591 [Caerostris extrusa]
MIKTNGVTNSSPTIVKLLEQLRILSQENTQSAVFLLTNSKYNRCYYIRSNPNTIIFSCAKTQPFRSHRNPIRPITVSEDRIPDLGSIYF